MKSIKLVSLDAGGTLLKPWPSVGQIYAKVIHHHGVDLDPSALQKSFHQAFQTIQRPSLQTSEAKELTFWKDIVRHTLAKFEQVDDFDALFHDLWHIFSEASSWRLNDGCLDFLDHLKELSIPCIILSNWDSRLRQLIEKMNLSSYFDELVISSEIGFNKPAIELFNYVEETFHCPGEHILHVGDHLINDIQAARSQQWQCIHYDPKGKELTSPNVKSFTELRDLFL